MKPRRYAKITIRIALVLLVCFQGGCGKSSSDDEAAAQKVDELFAPLATGISLDEYVDRITDIYLGVAPNSWLISNAVPTVQISDDTFRKGEAIGITWSNAPGNRNDYVAVFPAGVIPDSEKILAWA